MVERLTDDQIAEFTEVFNLIDADSDGQISAEELGSAMRMAGQAPTEEELADMISEQEAESELAYVNNITGVSTIDLKKFLSVMAKTIQSGNPHEDLLDAFKTIDWDRDGYIVASELRLLLNNLGEEVTEQEAVEMIREADLDRDGKVNFEEFVSLMSRP